MLSYLSLFLSYYYVDNDITRSANISDSVGDIFTIMLR